MERLIRRIKEAMRKPDYRRYDAIHMAMGAMDFNKDEYGGKKIYCAAEVLELLELVAMDPERVDKKETALEVRAQEQLVALIASEQSGKSKLHKLTIDGPTLKLDGVKVQGLIAYRLKRNSPNLPGELFMKITIRD